MREGWTFEPQDEVAVQVGAPRVGFLGCGEAALGRMAAMLAAGEIEAAAVCDPDLGKVRDALGHAPDAVIVPNLREMLHLGLDAVAIATPAPGHAREAAAALKGGVAVFCEHPLGLTAADTAKVVEIARDARRLLAVDLPWRFTEGMQRIREYIAGGEVGDVFAADLAFHLAEGPEHDWNATGARDRRGCAGELGTHLVDLALWTLGFPKVERVAANLLAEGVRAEPGVPEDYALATLTLAGGRPVRLACSWGLPMGGGAAIEAVFHGTKGSAAFANVGGSLDDFRADLYRGGQSEPLAKPGAGPWRHRSPARFAARLAARERFDKQAEHLVAVAAVIDEIYA